MTGYYILVLTFNKHFTKN